MLLRKNPDLLGRKVIIKMPEEAWKQYDQLVKDAAANKHSAALEEALAQALMRMMARARRELDHYRQQADQTRREGSH